MMSENASSRASQDLDVLPAHLPNSATVDGQSQVGMSVDQASAALSSQSRSWLADRKLGRFSGVIVWVGFMVLFGVWIPDTFLTWATVRTAASAEAITIIVALAVLPGLAAGVIDLSFAAIMGLGAVVCIMLQTNQHFSPLAASLVAVLVCSAAGVVNALLVVGVGIDSFIATLGTSSIFLAVAERLSGGNDVGPVGSAGFQRIANGTLWGISRVFVYAVLLSFVMWYALEHTKLGRRLAATGVNLEAARLAGVRTTRIRIGALLFSAFISGCAAVLLAAQLGSVQTSTSASYLLPTFAACFLASTQIKPGRFSVSGLAVAIVLLATGISGFELASGQIWIPDMFNGVALVGAVGFSIVLQRQQNARARRRVSRAKS